MGENSQKVQALLKKIPSSPGVYLMKNKDEDIIYVGKAKNLKNRVKSYFQQTDKQGIKTQKLVENIENIDWVEVNSETEALFLETNYIKEHRPKYNVLMKDDKHFVYLKINLVEDFPQLQIVREIKKDGAKYFGPKTSRKKLEDTLEFLKKIFPIHHCKNIAGHPCIERQMHKSAGPCMGDEGREEYKNNIKQFISFFEGKYEGIIEEIQKYMMEAAQNKKFEQAGKYRDLMQSVENIQESQLVSDTTLESRDIIGVFHDLGKTFIALFQVRAGKMIHNEHYTLQNEGSFEEMIRAFLTEFYTHVPDMPKEILIPKDSEDKDELEDWFKEKLHTKIKILAPQKGKKNELVELAMNNAKSFAERERARWMHNQERKEQAEKDIVAMINQGLPVIANPKGVKQFQEEDIQSKQNPDGVASSRTPRNDKQFLHSFPKRMECFDISHFQGSETVASMVVFLKGEEAKGEYRRYKLKTLENGEIDDFKSMEEVLGRRLLEIENQLSIEKQVTVSEDFEMRKLKKKEIEEMVLGIKKEKKKKVKDTDKKQQKEEKTPPVKYNNFYGLFKKEKLVFWGELKKHETKIFEIKKLSKEEKYEKDFFFQLYTLIEGKDLWILEDNMERFEEYGMKKLKTLEKNWKQKPGLVPESIAQESERESGFALKIRIPKKNKNKISFPDFLLIDGGKGQLSSVVKVFVEQGWKYKDNAFWKDKLKIIVCSIAKREEEIFFPGESKPYILPNTSEGSYLLQRLRDEAHRFAITFNRESREKTAIKSILDEIPGIGPVAKKKLLKTFGSPAGVKRADEKNLKLCVGEASAKIVREFFDKI